MTWNGREENRFRVAARESIMREPVPACDQGALGGEPTQGPLGWINLLFLWASQALYGIQELDKGQAKTRLVKDAICGHRNRP